MKNLNKYSLLAKLASKGHHISIQKGQLIIISNSEIEVPIDWLNSRRPQLIKAIINLLNIETYYYKSYTVGRYPVNTVKGKKLCEGVTLQFENFMDGEEAHSIFNVELTRERNTQYGKAGDDLPRKQFRVNKAHGFYKFWLRTGLEEPARKSAFYDCMGKLKSLLFIGEINNKGKFDNKTLHTLNVSYDTIKIALFNSLPDNDQTTARQPPDSIQTKKPDKEMASSHATNSLDENTGACINNCDLSLQGSALISSPLPYHLTLKKELDIMSNDEWLNDYENTI